MPFRFQGSYILLTYSQVPLDHGNKQDLLTFLGGISSKPFRFCIVGHERHLESGYHYHAFIDVGRRFSFTNERRFDWSGIHPNIKKPDNPRGAYHYVLDPENKKLDSRCDLPCCAAGHTLQSGEEPDFAETERVSRSDVWRRLLDDATSAESFLSAVRVADPYTFATRYQALDAMARSVFRQRTPYVSPYEPQDFVLPQTVEQWLLEEFDEEVSWTTGRVTSFFSTLS